MTAGTASFYDRYWSERDRSRARARSRARVEIGLKLLGGGGGSLLEVGCGPGWALERFREAGFQARGLDLSPRAVEEARARGLEAAVADLEKEEIPGSHDLIAVLEVLEHLSDPLAALGRLVKALKPGGAILASLPNEFSLPRRLAVLIGRPGFGGHDDPHLRHFDPAAARRLFKAAGLEVAACAWDGLCPPRWGRLKRLTDKLAQWWPGLFALSGVYLLRPREVQKKII